MESRGKTSVLKGGKTISFYWHLKELSHLSLPLGDTTQGRCYSRQPGAMCLHLDPHPSRPQPPKHLRLPENRKANNTPPWLDAEAVYQPSNTPAP